MDIWGASRNNGFLEGVAEGGSVNGELTIIGFIIELGRLDTELTLGSLDTL